MHERKHNGEKPFKCDVSISVQISRQTANIQHNNCIGVFSQVLRKNLCLSRKFAHSSVVAHRRQTVHVPGVWQSFFVHFEFAGPSKIASKHLWPCAKHDKTRYRRSRRQKFGDHVNVANASKLLGYFTVSFICFIFILCDIFVENVEIVQM